MYIQLSTAVCLTAFNSFHQTLHPDAHLTVIDTHSALIDDRVGQLTASIPKVAKIQWQVIMTPGAAHLLR
jgi:hypothetical protein